MDSIDQTRLMLGTRYRIASDRHQDYLTKWNNLDQWLRLGSLSNLNRSTDERGRIFQPDQRISRVTASVLWDAVESLAPRIQQGLNSEGWFTVLPKPGTKTTTASAFYVQNKMRNQVHDGRITRQMIVAAKQAVKFGSAILKLRWQTEYGKIYERDLQSSKASFRQGEVFDGPRVDLVPRSDFYPDPRGKSMEDCEYVIEESVKSIQFLMDWAEASQGYISKKQVEGLKYRMGRGVFGNDPTTQYDTRSIDLDPMRKNVRVVGYFEDKRFVYSAIPWGGTGFDGVLLNGVNQENPNDYQAKPFIQLSVSTDEDNFWPTGFIEPLRDNQAIQTTFLNMAIDAGIMELRPMKAINAKMEMDVKEIQNYVPNKVVAIEFNTGGLAIADQIYEFKPSPNGVLATLPVLMSMMKQQEQSTSGNTPYTSGQAGVGSNKTARGVIALSENAMPRINTISQIYSEGAVDLLEMIHVMNQQFGNPGEDQYGEYQFRAMFISDVDRASRIQLLQGTLPILATIGGNVEEALRRIYMDGGIPAIDALMPQDGSMQTNQKNQAMMNYFMAQQQGGGNAGMG